MSYCRFSSLNWSCDVYAYADVAGGYTIHVARSRRVGDIPADPFESFMSVDFKNDPKASAEWLRLYKEHSAAVNASELVPIDLPHAGETFRETELEDFKARLIMLRDLGYRFPPEVLADIDAEIIERDNHAEE